MTSAPSQSTDIQKANGGKPITNPGNSLKTLLESRKDALAQVATKHLPAEKLIRLLGLAVSRQPELLKCTPLSILNCAMTFAEVGLLPSTLGTAYMVPFYNNKAKAMEAMPIIGYKGYITLARRSGDFSEISCDIVRDGDEFEYRKGTEQYLRHVPKAPRNAEITHAWCVAKFKSGGHQIEVMRKDEIDEIRSMSKAGQFGPWKDHYEEMAKKTVIRRAAKLWPLTPEVEGQVAAADKTEFKFTDLGATEETPEVPANNLDAARNAVQNVTKSETDSTQEAAAKVEELRANAKAAAGGETAQTPTPDANADPLAGSTPVKPGETEPPSGGIFPSDEKAAKKPGKK